MKGLAIKEVAERTGIAAATIRMWEQRYGFPEPARTASGYRDVHRRRRRHAAARQHAARQRPVRARRARARARLRGATDRPSIYGAIAAARRRCPPGGCASARCWRSRARSRTRRWPAPPGPSCSAPSSPCATSAAVEHRYGGSRAPPTPASCSPTSSACASRRRTRPRCRSRRDDALGNEWAVVVDAPGYAACLLAWETPESQRDDHLPDRERRFEALWTLDPRVVRRAALVGAALAAPRRRGARRRGSRRCCATARSPSRRPRRG